MKKLLPKSVWRPVVCSVLTALASPSISQAGLNVPYTNDVSTLHLWHLDDPLLIGGVTNILATDAVATASITLTNLGNPNPGVPPYVNTSLGNASFPGFNLGNATQNTDKNAMCYGGLFSDVSSFCNPDSGAFTFEALVYFNANPLGPLPNNMEIVCGDQPSGTLAARGWQFRINNAKQMEFNLLGGSGSDNDWKASLPSSGPDIALQAQWYHVAVTFTGISPTNGDTAYLLKFYWTPLDPGRTNADLLATFTMTRGLNGTTALGAGTVQPGLGIGGSARKITTGGNGVANGEGLIGLMDEVRISNVARGSNEMAFITGGAIPPKITQQPPASTLIGYGKTLAVNAAASGSQPLAFQWQATNSSAGGFTNVPGETNNSLVISNVGFDASGYYRLSVTNAYGQTNSIVAQVTVGAAISEIFSTGVDTNGVVDTNTLPGNADVHYVLVQSADPNHLGPNPIVWNMFTYPIAAFNGNFSAADGDSQWIGTENDNYVSPVGTYVYRTTFLLDSVDTTKPVTLSGIWFVNELATDILINGVSTGNSIPAVNSSAGKFSAPFTITNGFHPGLNTLDFVTQRTSGANGSYQESALRVEVISAVGQALAPGVPAISTHPASQSVHDGTLGGQSSASFAVVATGRPPLSYQWWADNAPLSGATNRTLKFISPTQGGQGTNFSVVVQNASGSVTSHVAVLTILTTNQPPVAPSFSFTMYSNTTLNVSIDTLYLAASDADNDPLSITWDAVTTNGVSLTQNGIDLAYTPNTDYVGADEFNYSISDGITTTASPVLVNVVPLLLPSTMSASVSAGNIHVTAKGASPGGPFHVISSTDLTAPTTNWVTVATGNFDGSGNCNVPLPVTPSVPQAFYRIAVP